MQLSVRCKVPLHMGLRKKIVIFLILLLAGVKVQAQLVSISEKNVSLEQVFNSVKKQTGLSFFYDYALLKNASKISINVKNATVDEVLKLCLKNLPLTYKIVGQSIVIKEKADEIKTTNLIIKGYLSGDNGPIPYASVLVKGTDKGAYTDEKGLFVISDINDPVVLVFNHIGFEKKEITLNNVISPVFIHLKTSVSKLDEVQVLAYGQKTSQRMATGSTSRITADVIEKQATADPIAALQGRAPGLVITNTSGLPGAAVTVQIRGINTLNPDGKSRQPLFIVDGVPFSAGTLSSISTQGFLSTGSYESPFKSIDPASIESIEVLKDADATAIYGARGANGVILINTKRGKKGKPSFLLDAYSTLSTVPRFIKMLNTQQYLAVRRETFKNDGVAPDINNAPDLLLWDTTAYTNWQKKYFGSTAHTNNAEATFSGGNDRIRFLLGAGYRNEKTVYSKTYGLERGNIRLNTDYNSSDQKLNVILSLSYETDRNNTIALDPTTFYTIPPDFPVYNKDGSLNWAVPNPEASALQTLNNRTKNVITNMQVGYRIIPGLNLKASIGYTKMRLKQEYLSPAASQNPSYGILGSARFSDNKTSSFIFEPQADYNFSKGRSKFEFLAGGTYINNNANSFLTEAFNYRSDSAMKDLSTAGIVNTLPTGSGYRFLSGFGRLGYNWKNEYLLNLTVRRDGSSRFGPNKRYGNFGAVGVAWIFSEEPFMKKHFPFLSYGKLRGSYGITGNDNIGDFQYFVNYELSLTPYQVPTYSPSNLYNAGYQWEVNKKLEAALELGFLQDKITIITDYFRNRSDNQLISNPQPGQSGIPNVTENLNALVQNSGFEFQINTSQLKHEHFSWSTSMNFSIARNKLLSYPGLANSSYSNTYAVGKPLSLFWGYEYQGIDPQTGATLAKDLDKDGSITYPNDYKPLTSSLPSFYGGLNNSFSYKTLQLDIFFSFKKMGKAFFTFLNPGAMANQPIAVLDRWQQPGDISRLPEYSTLDFTNLFIYNNSQANLYNASYIRLGSVSLSYNFTQRWVKKAGMESLRLYATGNNLFTITHYPGLDPETGTSMPVLRAVSFGIKSSF